MSVDGGLGVVNMALMSMLLLRCSGRPTIWITSLTSVADETPSTMAPSGKTKSSSSSDCPWCWLTSVTAAAAGSSLGEDGVVDVTSASDADASVVVVVAPAFTVVDLADVMDTLLIGFFRSLNLLAAGLLPAAPPVLPGCCCCWLLLPSFALLSSAVPPTLMFLFLPNLPFL